MADLVPRCKLWLESDSGLVMSDYRLRLLALVAETGSLASAASAMHLSYRRAWGKIKELEANLGFPLVRSEVGGAGGGHTTLTDEGRQLVEAYDRFRRRVEAAVSQAFAEELAPLAQTGTPTA
ncbi:MAG: molybdenum-pterin-binding protein [Tepidiforma sp.]|nr:MAG: molybdenum-pterin-binding protein [Tepidiforma sp.]